MLLIWFFGNFSTTCLVPTVEEEYTGSQSLSKYDFGTDGFISVVAVIVGSIKVCYHPINQFTSRSFASDTEHERDHEAQSQQNK